MIETWRTIATIRHLPVFFYFWAPSSSTLTSSSTGSAERPAPISDAISPSIPSTAAGGQRGERDHQPAPELTETRAAGRAFVARCDFDRRAGAAQRGAEQRAGAAGVPAGGDEQHVVRLELPCEACDGDHVRESRLGIRVDDDPPAGRSPRSGHLLGLRVRAPSPRPTGQEDDVVRPRRLLGAAQAPRADLVQLLALAVRVPADGDQPCPTQRPLRPRRQIP